MELSDFLQIKLLQSDIKKMWDELPEEERNGNMGKILGYITDLCQSGWSFREALKNVGEICTLGEHIDTIKDMLGKIPEDGKEAILRAFDYQKRNASEAMLEDCWNQFGLSLPELRERIAEEKITDHQKIKNAILNTMKDFQKKESNKAITDMVYGSAFIAVFQFVKLYMTWKTISCASNLIESNPDMFSMISGRLQRMEQLVTELVDICERDPNNRKIPKKVVVINTHFTSILGKISNLRIKIDGQIQRVHLVADYTTVDYAAVDGVINLATSMTQGFQLLQLWDKLNSFTKGFGVVIVAVFMGFTAANAVTYVLSQQTLEILRRDMKEAVDLQNALQDLFEQAEQAFNNVEDN
ncbi:hypothetical protein AWC38_SpisGene13068 [Stylophora pistillata]|uniref:Uncharacterized protein n=1 Tax=Stylophora pistillata TaxID=50429 RepID=A0A2B4S1J3_STYPI|nr:hypothetical protein AWC38_SpisGene13068 [Stylophora pistillata]